MAAVFWISLLNSFIKSSFFLGELVSSLAMSLFNERTESSKPLIVDCSLYKLTTKFINLSTPKHKLSYQNSFAFIRINFYMIMMDDEVATDGDKDDGE